MKKKEAALEIIKKFIQTDPVKAAQALETLPPRDATQLLRDLPPSMAAQCVEHMPPAGAAALLHGASPEEAAAILHRTGKYHAADIFRSLDQNFSRSIVPLLDQEFSSDMAEMLAYPRDSAGRIMHTDFLSFRSDMKVREVILKLRQMAKKQLPAAAYCYVVDGGNTLLGVLNMRDLLLAAPEARVEEIMIRDVVKISPFTDREELVTLASRRHFLAVPVTGENGRLIGVVNTKNIIASTEAEATEDLQILFGASAEERPFSPVWFKITRRLPWLTINLATAFLAGSVVAMFEGFIAKAAVLAVFLPIIAGQGGNAGTQTLSIILRGMLMREVSVHNAWQLIKTELFVGFVNGLATGLMTAIAAWLWKGNAWLGLVVGVAMTVNMMAAGLSGAVIPLLMKRLGYDPAHSSGIFLTTVTDVVGFFAFLSTAWLLQSKIL
ncbi:MAG TPA: magnesium transporter [Elusimicrobia bacterium]|nr:MAG: magnesium transporter [Elusimicrobia bacterium GWF2_62_30]HBA62117.1 magnesium transporter [Elusimicrobiota bacterium]